VNLITHFKSGSVGCKLTPPTLKNIEAYPEEQGNLIFVLMLRALKS